VELVLIIVVLVILFGGKRIPTIGKGLGAGIRNFKRGLKGDRSKDDQDRLEDGDERKP
jgi:sec-independent protein translocase protein TatA